ncbi:GL21311, partial [Drosophila persimilis]
PLQSITPSILCQPISKVVQLLLAPYRQRFTYHFTGTRQTNRLDKPEWYYTQILNWGKDTHFFVGKTFQPAAIRAGKLDYNLRLEFIRGLVQLTIEKLAVDIEQISQDEILFAHLLDETLGFEAELRETFGYPASFPSAIAVITQPIHSVCGHGVSELEHWSRQLTQNLATRETHEMKARSMNYRHDCWPNMPEHNSKEPFILSSSGGEMFQVLVTMLHNLERELSANLFNQTLR